MKNTFKNTYGPSLALAFALSLILSFHSATAGDLQLGLAAVSSHSAIQGKPEETSVLPAIMYQGERLSFIYDTLAYRVLVSESLSISMTGRLRQKTYEPKDSAALNGMDKRDDAVDMGLRMQSDQSWGSLELEISGDISSTHDGYEVKASYGYPWIIGRWLVKPSVGVSYLSAQLVDYYYGVKDSEQKTDRAAYSGESVVNSFVTLSILYALTERWTMIAGIDYVSLGDAISRSPVVDENREATVFTAISYSY
jgi:outer membrane protein